MATLPLAGAVGQSKRTTAEAFAALKELDKQVQQGRGINFTGQARHYVSRVDGQPGPPDEDKQVGLIATDILARLRDIMIPVLDANLTRDVGNTQASAPVIVDGQVLLVNVPATYLLVLEKQIGNLYDIARAIPARPLGTDWQPTEQDGLYQSPERLVERHGPEVVYKTSAPIPDKGIHETLLDKYTVQVILGFWHERSFTGAMHHDERQALLSRIRTLLEAVKAARIKANSLEVEPQEAGEIVMNFILDGQHQAG